MYILRPHAAGISNAPPFYTPPTPRRLGGRFGYFLIFFCSGAREREEASDEVAGGAGFFIKIEGWGGVPRRRRGRGKGTGGM